DAFDRARLARRPGRSAEARRRRLGSRGPDRAPLAALRRRRLRARARARNTSDGLARDRAPGGRRSSHPGTRGARVSTAGGALSRELTRALTLALDAALAEDASLSAVRSAHDTAQVLGLGGLEKLLACLMGQVGRPRPAEMLPAIVRVKALAAQCA